MPTGEGVLPEELDRSTSKNSYSVFLKSKIDRFCHYFSFPVNALTKNLIPYVKNLCQPQSFARFNFSAAISGITEIRNLGLR